MGKQLDDIKNRLRLIEEIDGTRAMSFYLITCGRISIGFRQSICNICILVTRIKMDTGKFVMASHMLHILVE